MIESLCTWRGLRVWQVEIKMYTYLRVKSHVKYLKRMSVTLHVHQQGPMPQNVYKPQISVTDILVKTEPFGATTLWTGNSRDDINL